MYVPEMFHFQFHQIKNPFPFSCMRLFHSDSLWMHFIKMKLRSNINKIRIQRKIPRNDIQIQLSMPVYALGQHILKIDYLSLFAITKITANFKVIIINAIQFKSNPRQSLLRQKSNWRVINTEERQWWKKKNGYANFVWFLFNLAIRIFNYIRIYYIIYCAIVHLWILRQRNGQWNVRNKTQNDAG